MSTISTTDTRTDAFQDALDRAYERTRYSSFDNHVLELDDGTYTVIDEGDYPPLDQKTIDRICHTAPGRLSGLY